MYIVYIYIINNTVVLRFGMFADSNIFIFSKISQCNVSTDFDMIAEIFLKG